MLLTAGKFTTEENEFLTN